MADFTTQQIRDFQTTLLKQELAEREQEKFELEMQIIGAALEKAVLLERKKHLQILFNLKRELGL